MQLYSQNNHAFWLNGENPETAQLFEKFSEIERFLKISINEELRGLLVVDEFQYINDILQTYLLKDVRQYVRNQDFVGFNKLLKVLSSQIGNMLNINELSNTVQLPYRTCEKYIYLLEQMFIIHLVAPYTSNKRHEITKMKKIYFCDLGLRNIIYNSFNDIDIRIDKGQLFENYVYLELIKSIGNNKIYYYRTKDGTEIDFIVTDSKLNVIPIEVKYKNFNKAKKIRALTEFSKNKDNEVSYIINQNNQEFIGTQQYAQAFFINQIVYKI